MTKLQRLSSETFSSLSVRNFRLFFAGQTVSQIGNWLTLVAQALLVLKITDSGFAVGLLTAFQFVPVLLLGAWAGLVADRSDKRKLLAGVQVFAMAQSFVLGALAFMDRPPLWAIYLVAMAGGVATAFDNPARRSFVVEMVDAERVNNAVGLNSALMTGSRVIGPALAGILIATVGYGWAFVVDGLTYIAVIVGYLRMNPAEIHRGPVTPRGKGQVRAGFRYAMGKPELRIPLVMMAIIGTLAFNFTVVMPLLIKETFGGSDSTFTWFFSVISVGSMVGALMSARRSEIVVRDVVVAAAAFGVLMLALAVTPNLPLAFIVGVLFGVASIGFMTASTSIVQVEADPSMRGRVLALQAMVFLGSTPIGGPIIGQVCDWWGPRAGVAIGGVATLAAAGYGFVASQRGVGDYRASGIDTPIPPRVAAP
ncbi:MAG: MFS transporter [Microthrixaceae bacterium]|nr:MFS transporter [Microthrixaceae bacterium]